MSGKRRRHYSEKQIAAGFGGKRHRKARHHRMHGAAHPATKHVTVIPRQVFVSGKRRHHKRHHALLGGIAGRGVIGRSIDAAIQVLSGTGGYVVGSYAGNMIPFGGPMTKAATVTLTGILIAALAPFRFLQVAGIGVGVGGGFALAQNVSGNKLPTLAGISLTPEAQRLLLGMAAPNMRPQIGSSVPGGMRPQMSGKIPSGSYQVAE